MMDGQKDHQIKKACQNSSDNLIRPVDEHALLEFTIGYLKMFSTWTRPGPILIPALLELNDLNFNYLKSCPIGSVVCPLISNKSQEI